MRFLLTLFVILMSVTIVIAGTITGKVINMDTGKPLAGANVFLEGTTAGAATDVEGMYRIESDDGTYNLVCDYVGFARQTVNINISGNVSQDFELVEYLFAKTIEVIADRAMDRRTPVAYTNVNKQKMEAELGSQDIPMVLNTTPSVYATMSGGGPGDARINVRGFSQRNVAIMINGVPVNDMENGWLYWSNWDGVGDATSSIQMQRGLSAVNLATPSIGGTMNILTDPAAQKPGLRFKQEYGEGTFLKSTLFGHTGLIDDKYAVSAGVVRKVGDGVIDKTWTDAWAYYLGASYNINKDNRIELYAVGAPQEHGQNRYAQNIAAYSHDFAKDLDDYDSAALDKFDESDRGRLYNENWNTVSSSYKGKQAVESSTFDRHDSGFLNERENFYHKPVINLNWYSNLSSELSLASIFYLSPGTGGGSGPLENSIFSYHDSTAGKDVTTGALIWDYGSEPSRIADWDATIAMNRGTTDRKGNAKTAGESLAILRNSRNNQYTFGLISKLNWKVNENLKTAVGVDWRTAEAEHYREVRDLLGGDYMLRFDSDFWGASGKKLGLGDKVDYNNTNTIDWLGGFIQGEYTQDQWTAYGTFGFSGISYKYTDHFRAAKEDTAGNPILGSGKFTLESDPEYGYQIKGGAMYRVDANTEVYGNFGYVAKVPIFDQVIDDNNGVFSENPEPEKFTSFEAGANWRGLDNQLTLKGSFYYTKWTDRALPLNVESSPGVFDIFFLTGLEQLHTGFELEAAYQPMPLFRLDLAGSFGSWEHTSDAEGEYRALDSQGTLSTETYLVGVDGLKVGDAPQTQLAIAGTVFPIQGLSAQLALRYYDNFYADWNPLDRMVFGSATPDRGQSWQVPSYSLLDFHASYRLPINLKGVQFEVFAHVFNLLDAEYISDALDNSEYNSYKIDHDNDPDTDKIIANPHKADAAEVFLGMPRVFNIGVTVTY